MNSHIKFGMYAGVTLSFLIAFGAFMADIAEPSIQEDQTVTIAQEVQIKEKIELPFGGTNVLPSNRFVALYGNPAIAALGALGEQNMAETFIRVKQIALEYQQYSDEPVVPTLEIITTIASAKPTMNDDYSQEIDIDKIEPWVEQAEIEGVYVLLDLQPGRTDFLTQAKQYETLLLNPHVGLALDPEWRLHTPESRHLVKVGYVDANEINQTSQWLANLTKIHELPQKLFIVHQFKPSMITNRESINTEAEELAYIIHVDGHGTLGQKIDTWNSMQIDLPSNIFMGWKNFYDEDKPTPTVHETMSQRPKPWFISYQ
jgi:hypothetical protein